MSETGVREAERAAANKDLAAPDSTNVRTIQTPRRPRTAPGHAGFLLVRTGLAVGMRISPRLAGGWAEALFFTPPRPRPSRTSLPPGAHRLEVRGDRGPLAVWSWGSGPAVYLLHGWGGRAEPPSEQDGRGTARG